MREPAQRGFKSAYRYLGLREQPFQRPAVHVHRAVGALSAFAACAVSVVIALFQCHRVVGHHAVDVTAGDHEAVSRLSETCEVRVIYGLRYHSDSTVEAFKHTGDYCDTERGVIDIRVPRYADKVELLDTALLHILAGNRQERHSITSLFKVKS